MSLHNIFQLVKENITTAHITASKSEAEIDRKILSGLTNAEGVLRALEENDGVYIIEATDVDARDGLVYVQAYTEATLAAALESGKVKSVIGVIHTEKPPTPLITDGSITDGLVSDDVLNDPNRLRTVTIRPSIVRNFLAAGGVLNAVYPKEFAILSKDITAEQKTVYQAVCKEYATNLSDVRIDRPLSDEFSGATYLIEGNDGSQYVFSIHAYPARNGNDAVTKQWGMWLGDARENKEVLSRYKLVKGEFPEAGLPEILPS